MRLSGIVAILSLAFALSTSPDLQAAPVSWDGSAVSWDAFNQFNFNNATQLFPGFTADSIDTISGYGEYHNHSGASQTVNFDILLDGVWTNVFTTTWPNGSSALFQNLATPISFPSGVVSGIRFTSSPGSNQTFHFDSNPNNYLTFNFIQTPEPASMLAWGLLTGVGLVGYRLRRRKVAA